MVNFLRASFGSAAVTGETAGPTLCPWRLCKIFWLQLTPETRAWLIAHNGEPVPANVISEVTRLRGPLAVSAYWVSDPSTSSTHFSDEVTDWIEKFANGE
jgi:hypothetical protein